MTENLKLWDSVEKTDPSKTKNAKVSGQSRTAVDAQYKKKMITKAFGVYGLHWGVCPDSEKYERIHYENSTCLLIYNAKAFFMLNGERGEFPIAAGINESYITNGGKGYLKIDDEAVKKVRTDALTKGFTDLGFCSDIHMGMFDDQDYVAGANAKANIDKEDEREAAAKIEYTKMKDYVTTQISSTQSMSDPAQAVKALERVKQKVILRCATASFGSKGFETLIENEKEKRNDK